MNKGRQIIPFEDISNFNLLICSDENPLKDFKIPQGLFGKEFSIFDDLESMEIEHWENLLRNKVFSVNRAYGHSMFYFNKGIPDDQWFSIATTSNFGQTIEYFPNFKEQHFSNHFNFTYFVEIFFYSVAALYETIGHLIFKNFDFIVNENKRSNQISFKNAICKLKNNHTQLHLDLQKITKSEDFILGNKMRNDIAHNHPPYQISSGVSNDDYLLSLGVGKYTSSNEIKRTMIGYLKSVKKTFEVLALHLQQ